jgi:hypothetical protein
MKPKKPRLWLVALTERYEVQVEACTRCEALDRMPEFDVGSPVWHKITARVLNPKGKFVKRVQP